MPYVSSITDIIVIINAKAYHKNIVHMQFSLGEGLMTEQIKGSDAPWNALDRGLKRFYEDRRGIVPGAAIPSSFFLAKIYFQKNIGRAP